MYLVTEAVGFAASSRQFADETAPTETKELRTSETSPGAFLQKPRDRQPSLNLKDFRFGEQVVEGFNQADVVNGFAEQVEHVQAQHVADVVHVGMA
ncbi:group_II [Pseudomonas syringae pv. actinidiae]|nr:hypothetical protein BV361_00983 [Pseudomonas syringae pv. actinidiae]